MAGFHVDVRTNVADLTRRIAWYQRDHVPFVTAYALTKTAQDVRTEERKVMQDVFDRPTRFTLNSLFVKPATKHNLTAIVHFKEGFGSVPAWRYLGPQVEGGPRRHKSFERHLIRAGIMRQDEFAVPGQGVRLDAYGNMRGGDISRILSQLAASPDAHQNITRRSKARVKKRGAARYLLLRGTRAADGIYHRKGTREIMPVLIFVPQPQYAKRFPFFETAQQVSRQRFAPHFHEGWTRYVSRGPSVRRLAA